MSRWISPCALTIALFAAASAAGCSNGPPGPEPAPSAGPAPAAAAADGPRFNAEGELLPPSDYRGWVFVTSGFSMAYGPAAAAMAAANIKVMDNVFVPRPAYDAFLKSGVWPDGTLFVLEGRASEGTGSIVNGGHYQTDLVAIEAHVKDSKRYEGGWGFYVFDSDDSGPTRPAKLLPKTAGCYECHEKNGAVDTTFTQFYPTLYPAARAGGTVRGDFVGIPASPSALVAAIEHGGWKEGEGLLDETAKKWPDANLAREGALNTVGYRLLAAGKKGEAIEVLAYVTRHHAASVNAWDSLSEAYESAGKNAEALAAVEKGLEALSGDKALAGQRRDLLEKSLRERKGRLAKL